MTERQGLSRWRTCFLLLIVALLLGCSADSGTKPSAMGRANPEADLHPIVDASEHQLFGASQGGEWLTAKQTTEHVKAGQTYRVYRLTDTLEVHEGSAPMPPDETCENPGVRIQNLPENGLDLIAISGDWNALTRKPVLLNPDQDVYKTVLSEHLLGRGIKVDEVSLEQIVQTDLEGDGVNEVLIVSNRIRGSSTSALPGDYAIVLLRTVIEGQVQQIPLEEQYFPDGCIAQCAPSTYRVAAILDTNGDGIMEVITGFRYFEGEGKRIHSIEGGTTKSVLSWTCGV